MKTLGIVAHSAEGGALCFLTACREGQKLLGPHMHPEIVVSAIPMGRSMAGWESEDHDVVAGHLSKGVEQVAAAGADFWICPDNTAHIVLERIADELPIPGMHIADVVAREMVERGFEVAGLLGTEWTMTGTVYPAALERRALSHRIPAPESRSRVHAAIFDELCRGVFLPETTDLLLRTIDVLAEDGADCVILGCTELPLVVSEETSSIPVLDSTRLLARCAVREATDQGEQPSRRGWLTRDPGGAA